MGTGGIYRFKDGREVGPTTSTRPGSTTAAARSVLRRSESNALIILRGVLRHEGDAHPAGRGRGVPVRRGDGRPATGLEVTPKAAVPALEASESRVADAAGRRRRRIYIHGDRLVAYRTRSRDSAPPSAQAGPLLCGPDRAMDRRGRASRPSRPSRKTPPRDSAADRAGAHVTGPPDADGSRAHRESRSFLPPHIDWLAFPSTRATSSLRLPGWARAGTPLAAMECGGILQAATGPFRRLVPRPLALRADPGLIEQFRIGLVLIACR